MNQIFKFKSDKLCPWPNSHSLPKPGNSHPGDDPCDLEAKGTLLSPRSVLPPVSLSSNRELLAQRRKEGGRVSESRVVTELTWHWNRKGHCPGVQGTGLGGPVPRASLFIPFQAVLSTSLSEKRGMACSPLGNAICFGCSWGGQLQTKGALTIHFPGQRLRFSSSPTIGSLALSLACFGLHGSACSEHPSSIIHSNID